MASKKKHDFVCPDNMVRHVEYVLAGEYDFHMVDIEKPWLVADVGACCGDFALWMRHKAEQNKLPLDGIDCFEPNPEAVEYLKKNAEWIDCRVISCAITPTGGKAHLVLGENNLGESEATDKKRPGSKTVPALKAAVLNNYDLIKLDCEGAEADIVLHDSFSPSAKVILMEYHQENERNWMIDKLESIGYRLSDGKVDRRDRGTLTFYKNEYAELVRLHLEAQKR